MPDVFTLEFDGGSRGNPGPAGIGVVLRDPAGAVVFQLGRFIGTATNNVAEYNAVIAGLRAARERGIARLAIRGDSELIIRQLNGQYRVKSPDLQPLHREARQLLELFDEAAITHNYREHNHLADRLANLAMDRRADVTGLPAPQELPPADAPAGARWACPNCGCTILVEATGRLPLREQRPFQCVCGQPMRVARTKAPSVRAPGVENP